jgi:hypothetical protein
LAKPYLKRADVHTSAPNEQRAAAPMVSFGLSTSQKCSNQNVAADEQQQFAIHVHAPLHL